MSHPVFDERLADDAGVLKRCGFGATLWDLSIVGETLNRKENHVTFRLASVPPLPGIFDLEL